MRKRQHWFVAVLVVLMLVSSTLGGWAQTQVVPERVIQQELSEEAVSEPAPVMDLPVTGGQDYIEPGVTPVMSRDRAVELAKEALMKHVNVDVSQDDFQLNTEYRKDWQYPEKYVWSLYWSLNEPMAYANANVTLDAQTGQVLDMNQDRGSYGEPQQTQLNLTREEAKDIAADFIEKLLPGKLDHMLLRDTQETYPVISHGGPLQYNFNYVRLIDGIVYDANFVNINIDGHSGDIKSFSQRWEEAPELPDSQGIMSVEEAEIQFKGNIKLELFYLPIRNEFMYEAIPKEFRLAYRLDPMMSTMINAKTGKPVDWSGKDGSLEQSVKDLSNTDKNRIADTAKPIVPRDQPMGQEDAEQLARKYAKELIDLEIHVQASNYMEGDQYWEAAGRKTWNIDFSTNEETQGEPEMTSMPSQSNGRIMVNALTGQLIALNWWRYIDGPYEMVDEPAINWEEGYDIAIDAIATYHPGKINDIRTLQRNGQNQGVMDGQMSQPMEYYYNFPRLIDGVLFDENQISIGVNAQTGKITNYTDRWSEDLVLPRKSNVMNQEQALEKLLSNYRMELAYFRYNASQDYMNPTYETKLVYRWMPNESTTSYPYVDAVSGQFIDYNGRTMPDRDATGFEERIQGHWVERTARLMAQQGIIDTTIFNPNEPITNMGWVKMMVKARGTDFYGPVMEGMGGDKVEFTDVSETDEDLRYIQWAIRYGYIDTLPENFQRNALVAREEAAVMMARFMGYQKLAEVQGIFRLQYDDAAQISLDAVGAVAINQGLEVISEGGSFRPKDSLTMAEAAQMLFTAVAQQRR